MMMLEKRQQQRSFTNIRSLFPLKLIGLNKQKTSQIWSNMAIGA